MTKVAYNCFSFISLYLCEYGLKDQNFSYASTPVCNNARSGVYTGSEK